MNQKPEESISKTGDRTIKITEPLNRKKEKEQ